MRHNAGGQPEAVNECAVRSRLFSDMSHMLSEFIMYYDALYHVIYFIQIMSCYQ
jgi:hypothetical protein